MTTEIVYRCRLCARVFRFEVSGHHPDDFTLAVPRERLHQCPDINGRQSIGVADLQGIVRLGVGRTHDEARWDEGLDGTTGRRERQEFES